ncbi:PAS domain-containing protein [Candidatus Lokiarchaeum ossiferum]|uniref:PAS domain-containing protein n=1 Tax=Candidatus Lokiarchaeum ossiferum TaxID=2951803 RepID=UPI00352D0A47
MVEKLSYSELETIVEQSPIMIWRSDLSKKCNYFNETWLKFTGRSFDQEIGDGWTEGVHPDDFDGCVGTYISFFEKKEAFEMEYRLKRHDGEYRWIFDRGAPFFDENGLFKGYIGSCVDVHARKLAEIENNKKMSILEKYVPICSWCSSVRKDDGYWDRISEYLTSEHGIKLTHGICPNCQRKYES